MICLLDRPFNAVLGGFFVPDIPGYFTNQTLAGLADFELALAHKSGHPADTIQYIVVSIYHIDAPALQLLFEAGR